MSRQDETRQYIKTISMSRQDNTRQDNVKKMSRQCQDNVKTRQDKDKTMSRQETARNDKKRQGKTN